jgi:hypothetical protein
VFAVVLLMVHRVEPGRGDMKDRACKHDPEDLVLCMNKDLLLLTYSFIYKSEEAIYGYNPSRCAGCRCMTPYCGGC